MSTQPRILILRAPGTNCDEETEFAFAKAGGRPERVHIRQLLQSPPLTRQYQILCIPGGFSYGDDIAAGRILANQIGHDLADTLQAFRDEQKLILGICNGFQVLLRTGILLEEDESGPVATLTWNDSRKFEDRWVNLSAGDSNCVYLGGVEHLTLPVAHAEGKFVASSDAVLEQLDRQGQLVLRYGSGNRSGTAPLSYPDNPNGSQGDVAGVSDSSGRVFGLMPHPERHIDPMQHPQWTRRSHDRDADGQKIFENAVRFFQ